MYYFSLVFIYWIFRKLTGTPTDCPRYGPHWDIIGFQVSTFFEIETDFRTIKSITLPQEQKKLCFKECDFFFWGGELMHPRNPGMHIVIDS